MERLQEIIGLTVIFAGSVVASALTIAEWLRRLENVITGSGGSHV
jgi:mannose/fructose-specific phosphotransferase system component IIA